VEKGREGGPFIAEEEVRFCLPGRGVREGDRKKGRKPFSPVWGKGRGGGGGSEKGKKKDLSRGRKRGKRDRGSDTRERKWACRKRKKKGKNRPLC